MTGPGPGRGDPLTCAVPGTGVTLAYELTGAGDPPIVFVHGWCGDRGYLAPQARHFAARHRVLTLDLRGHGDSSTPAPEPGAYDVASMASDVLAVARAAGLARPVLAGHSLGALIGLACAARPGAIRALAMIEPAPITNDRVRAFFRESVPTARADRDASWRLEFFRTMFLPTDACAGRVLAEAGRVPAPVAAAVLLAMGEFDGAAALRHVTVPVLSIGADHPVNAAADLRQACPQIMIGQTVGAGHFNQLEVPAQVNAMLEKFLDLVAGSAPG
jgi:pimeloyl-ACP methyl ester carboxylesterase